MREKPKAHGVPLRANITGATVQQIEDAEQRHPLSWMDNFGEIEGFRAHEWAAWLVPIEYRIVLADDLEHLLNAWDRHVECVRDGYQCEVWMEERAAVARLRAAIDTPTVEEPTT